MCSCEVRSSTDKNMKIIKCSFIVRIPLVSIVFLISSSLFASDFSPPGLYEAEHYTLDNGLDVILKPRQGAHTFSVRVLVGVGTQDFPCEQQETPHFLEHLLFTGTSRYTEAELDHLVADHGGAWNAGTGIEDTIYKMDIYSRYANFAINTLYEIITDSSITDEKVEKSRDIIHRESGGAPSQIRKWFRLHGIGISGTEKAIWQLLPGVNYLCEGYVTAEDITRDEIIKTFNKYYVPGNMALIAVGDFNKHEMIKQIQHTFGNIADKPVPERIQPEADDVTSFKSVTGTLSPMLSNDAVVGVIYRLPGYWSDDHYPIMLIVEYLAFKLNEVIRIERGLAYSPGTWIDTTGQFGLLGVSSDVNLDDIDEALSLIKVEMSLLDKKPMTLELLEKTRLKILRQSVPGYETNRDFADYYVSKYVLFRKNRFYKNNEEKLEAVTVDDITRVVSKYLSDDKGITIIETPTLTFTQFYSLLSLIAVVIMMAIVIFYIRSRTR